jgi:ferredoxin-NADP reductase
VAETEAETEPGRRRIKQLEVMVAEAIVETPDTTTLVFFTGNDKLDYRPGHFLTIDPHQFDALERFVAYLEDQKGKREPPRAYSMCSAPHEKYLAVTVKEERYISSQTRYPPLLSPMLVKRTPRGSRMVLTGFTGPYTVPDDIESKTDHLVHVCAGSGIVPNYSIIKHCLRHLPKLRHTLVYSNKSWDDVIFQRDLEALERAHPERLRVIHTLTRSMDGAPAGVRKGRVARGLLEEAIPAPTECFAYTCGPAITKWDRQEAKARGAEPQPRFLETVHVVLAELGVPKNRIEYESYG